jgi:2-keto-4-pentenoate hydratase
MPAGPQFRLAARLAARLAEARRAGVPFAPGPDLELDSLAAAYEAQAEVARLLGARPAGWKVGFAPKEIEGGPPWAAPILDCDLREDGGVHRMAPGGLVKIEAELGIVFARDLVPQGRPLTRADVVDSLAEAFVGIELIISRFVDPARAGFATRVADSFSNGAYAIGARLRDFRALDLSQLPCKLVVGGKVCNERVGGHADGDPLIPVVAWANAQVDRLGGLRAGQFLSTGTLNEPVVVQAPLDGPVLIEASLGGIGQARLTLV